MAKSPLAWGAKVSPEFRNKVYQVCSNLGWPEPFASYLMACMAFETRRTFSSSTRNRSSGAIGLIQFMRGTAKALKTTTDALAKMSDVQQLDYVEKYFRPYAKSVRDLESMYMAILWPKAIPNSLSYVLWKMGTGTYFANRGLDTDKNGVITKKEAASKVREQLTLGLQKGNVFVDARN